MTVIVEEDQINISVSSGAFVRHSIGSRKVPSEEGPVDLFVYSKSSFNQFLLKSTYYGKCGGKGSQVGF